MAIHMKHFIHWMKLYILHVHPWIDYAIMMSPLYATILHLRLVLGN